MTRKKQPDPELVRKLLGIKLLVADLGDAMPTAAREIRRSIREELDDLISERT